MSVDFQKERKKYFDAFEEYLFEGKDVYIDKFGKERSVLSMENFTPQQRRAVLFDPDFALTPLSIT